jgi:hypothetical protein|tara:strand:- start:20 stop:322 length:303 start_codon:yes stop_codon:yes gene_type:complete
MSSYDKTVAQWRKDHPPKTREEVEAEVKERATQQLYRANGEFYLDPKHSDFKNLFKDWPSSGYSSAISSSDYERCFAHRMDEFKTNKKQFFDNIIDKREK